MGNNQYGSPTRPLSENELRLLSNQTGMSQNDVLEWHDKFLRDYPDGFLDKVNELKIQNFHNDDIKIKR
jgi:hypothetical protein